MSVVNPTDPDNTPEFERWRSMGMEAIRNDGPVLVFGRKPTFKNIRTLTEQEVEAMKSSTLNK